VTITECNSRLPSGYSHQNRKVKLLIPANETVLREVLWIEEWEVVDLRVVRSKVGFQSGRYGCDRVARMLDPKCDRN